MKQKKRYLLIPLIALALIIAHPLQSVIRDVLIKPLLYFGWGIGILFRSVPQFWLWMIFLGIVFFILLTPFIEDLPRWKKKEKALPPEAGPIEKLAETLDASNKGIYFKWVVANRLGKVLSNWLLYRNRVDQRWQAKNRARLGWNAPPEIYNYLDVGLNGSFADYPRPRIPFIQKRAKTPLDIDPNIVLNYLENEMESESCE